MKKLITLLTLFALSFATAVHAETDFAKKTTGIHAEITEYCGIERQAARLAHNQKVAGSSPVSATNLSVHYFVLRVHFCCFQADTAHSRIVSLFESSRFGFSGEYLCLFTHNNQLNNLFISNTMSGKNTTKTSTSEKPLVKTEKPLYRIQSFIGDRFVNDFGSYEKQSDALRQTHMSNQCDADVVRQNRLHVRVTEIKTGRTQYFN